MEFRLLGPFEVSDGNGPIPLGGPKQRTVLVHLLNRPNRLVPADRLIDEVWGDDPPEAARNSLQSYVSHLRRALGPERLEGRSRGYVLHVDPSEVDAVRFEAIVGKARTLAATDPAAAAQGYTDALAIWRGPALDDLADQPSLRPEIARLEELRTASTEERVTTELTLGRHAELIPELDTLTAKYPLRERLWGQLMVALYRSGRQGESLAAFRRARDILAEELGISPSSELQHLHERVLRQDPSLDLVGEPLRGYRLLKQVGVTAVSAVYRAFQPQVGREVAVKVIHPQLANDPEFIRRFEAEAQVIARLEHPHIVPLYDYWREPDRAYLVMRFLRGGSLRDALTRGPLGPETAVRVIDHIASALAAAHRQGIIHRDVRPENILFDEDGNAYLSDFGIAKGRAATQGTAAEATPNLSAFYVSPEEIQGEAATPRTDVYSLGRVLYEMLVGQHPDAYVGPGPMAETHLREPGPSAHPAHAEIGADVDEVIGRATAKDPDERYPDAPSLAAALRVALGPVVGRAVPVPAVEARNPYKGLRPFLEADTPDFFGREELVKRLVARMADDHGCRLLAIVGPSGSGKSSLVRAGLVPALRQGVLPGSEDWFVVDMLPGSQPFAELQAALLRIAASPAPPNLCDQLEGDEQGLMQAVKWVLPNDNSELVLLIDQFEELFTLTEEEDRRARFLASLVAAATHPRSRVRVLLTLRADFYDRPLLYKDFGDLLAAGTHAITPLSTGELERAISGPARRVEFTVEPALEAEIAAEVAGQPGALPLFQYTLTELFERQRDGVLTIDAYRDIGGVTGALARRAEEIYGGLDLDGKAAARQLFLRLVTLGEEGSEDTRRRVLRTELSELEIDPQTIGEVVDAFGAHRLLSFDRDPLTRGPTVEVAHEALLSRWARLRTWVEAAREDVRTERRLAAAATEWEDAGRDPSFLLGGGHLSQFEGWASTSGVALGGTEREYLAASVARRKAEYAAEEGRRTREKILERRSRLRLRALVALFAVLALVASGLTILTLNQRERAQREALVAGARGLAAAAVANLDVDPERSILLAMEAVRAYQSADVSVEKDAVEALHQAVQASRVVLTIRGLAGGGAQLSPDGTRLATAGTMLTSNESGTDVAIWDARTGRQLIAFRAHETKIWDLEFSPDGSRLVTASGDQTAKVWDAMTGDRLSLLNHEDAIYSASFSPDGAQVATSGQAGVLRIWDAETGDLMKEIGDSGEALAGNKFSPDGTLVAAGTIGGAAMVWDVRTGDEFLTLEGHDLAVNSVSFSPDGQRLATASQDGTGKVWDLRTGDELLTLEGQNGPVYHVQYSPDGTRMATGSEDATARVWDAETGKELLVLSGHRETVGNLSFSPDGTLLATGSDDGTARIWDVTPQGSREALIILNPVHAGGMPPNVAYSPDGTRLVTPGPDGQVRIWDASSGETVGSLSAPGEVFDVAVSPDGGQIAATALDFGLEAPSVTVWDATSGAVVRVLEPVSSAAFIVPAYSPDGRFLVSGTSEGTATVWDAATGAAVRTLRHGPSGIIFRARFSPDGSRLALVGLETGNEFRLSVWDVPSWSPLSTLAEIDRFPVYGADFSPDGSRVVTGLGDGTARIWDLATGEEVVTLAGHSGAVWDATFSPDGAFVATAGGDTTVRLWDPSSGEEVLRLKAASTASEVAFSPDGSRLVTANGDGTVRVYLLRLGELMDLAQDRLTRSFTQDECRQYLHLERCPDAEAGPVGAER